MLTGSVSGESIFDRNLAAYITYFHFHVPALVSGLHAYTQIIEFRTVTEMIVIPEINTAIHKHAAGYFVL